MKETVYSDFWFQRENIPSCVGGGGILRREAAHSRHGCRNRKLCVYIPMAPETGQEVGLSSKPQGPPPGEPLSPARPYMRTFLPPPSHTIVLWFNQWSPLIRSEPFGANCFSILNDWEPNIHFLSLC